jgi:CelD/BcsL family acetyltransferase involved in cellulose biosynthesis
MRSIGENLLRPPPFDIPAGIVAKGNTDVSQLHTIQLASVADLRAAAFDWDDLWQRSEPTSPLKRAETLAQWIEQFHPRARFRAIVIADSRHWIAALPLISHRVGWVIPAASLPSNPWALCGDLLCDAGAADNDAAMDLLLATAADLPWHMLWLENAEIESPRWQSLFRTCDRAGVSAHCHPYDRYGRVVIASDWNAYQKQWAKSHRQGMNRLAKRLEAEGSVEFQCFTQLDPQQIEPWLREAFQVEDLSWKGDAGSSVIRTPEMFGYFVAQARQLAAWGQLETAALRLDGRMIAFLYGFRGKGVLHAQKIGYDPQFSAFSPGQLLFYKLFERLYADGRTRALDFIGPMSQSLSRWRPETYAIGRIALAPRRLLGRAAMVAYENVWRPFHVWQTPASVCD